MGAREFSFWWGGGWGVLCFLFLALVGVLVFFFFFVSRVFCAQLFARSRSQAGPGRPSSGSRAASARGRSTSGRASPAQSRAGRGTPHPTLRPRRGTRRLRRRSRRTPPPM